MLIFVDGTKKNVAGRTRQRKKASVEKPQKNRWVRQFKKFQKRMVRPERLASQNGPRLVSRNIQRGTLRGPYPTAAAFSREFGGPGTRKTHRGDNHLLKQWSQKNNPRPGLRL